MCVYCRGLSLGHPSSHRVLLPPGTIMYTQRARAACRHWHSFLGLLCIPLHRRCCDGSLSCARAVSFYSVVMYGEIRPRYPPAIIMRPGRIVYSGNAFTCAFRNRYSGYSPPRPALSLSSPLPGSAEVLIAAKGAGQSMRAPGETTNLCR